MSRKSALLSGESELVRRSFQRVDRRAGGGMRRPGRGSGGSRADVGGVEPIYAVGNFGGSGFATANYYATPANGGEIGDEAGFLVLKYGRLESLPTAVGLFGGRTNAASQGWRWLLQANGQMQGRMYNGAGALVSTPAGPGFVASDVGKLHVIGLRHTGSAVEVLGGRATALMSQAIAGYSLPTSRPHLIGIDQGSAIGAPFSVVSELTVRGQPSQATLEALWDYVRTAGDFPVTFAGLDIRHRWSLRDALRGVPNPKGRVTHGVRRYTAASYLHTENPGGIAGVGTGFHAMFHARFDLLSGVQVFAGRDNLSNAGWRVGLSAASLTATFTSGGGTQTNTATFTVPTTMLGRLVHVCIVHTGTVIRLLIDGAQVGSDVACVGFTPHAGRMFVGTVAGGSYPSAGTSVFAVSGGHAVPSNAEVAASAAATEASGVLQPIAGKSDQTWYLDSSSGVPASFSPVAAGDALAVVGALEAARYVETAPPAPASIADTVTNASVDAMGRNNTPAVVEIDPTTDGRKTLGVHGFSTTSYLATAPGKGIRGDLTAFHVKYRARFDTVPGAIQILAACSTSGGDGWQLYLQPGGVLTATARAVDNGNATTYIASSPANTVRAGDVEMVMVQARDGFLRVYYKGAKVAEIAAPGTLTATAGSVPMYIGIRGALTLPSDATSFFELEGGHTALTDQEIETCFAETARLGRIASIKAEHSYRPELDIEANGGPQNGVPATVLDRVGTDHLTRVGGLRVDASGAIFGFASGVNISSATSAAGLKGSTAGHWYECLVEKRAHTIASQVAFSHYDGNGWYLNIFNGQAFPVMRATPNALVNCAYALSDGRHHIGVVYDGAKQILYVDGVNVAESAPFVYVPPASGLMGFGGIGSGLPPLLEHGTYGGSGGLGVPSGAQMAAAAASALASGKCVGIAGLTNRRWVFPDDVSDAGGAVPARYAERQGSGEALTRVGAALQVATRVERLHSYETKPITYGAKIASTADHYTLAAGVGFLGDPLGFLVELDFTALAQTAGTRVVIARRAPGTTSGYVVQFGTNLSNIIFSAGNGIGSSSATPAAAIGPSDIGKRQYFAGWWDPVTGKVRGAFKRAQVSDGTALAGPYVPSTEPLYIGRRSDSFAATDILIHGFRFANFAPSTAEYQAAYDRWAANERFSADDYAGRSFEAMYRFDDPVSPAVLQDLIGAAHLTRVGAPTIEPVYNRALGV